MDYIQVASYFNTLSGFFLTLPNKSEDMYDYIDHVIDLTKHLESLIQTRNLGFSDDFLASKIGNDVLSLNNIVYTKKLQKM